MATKAPVDELTMLSVQDNANGTTNSDVAGEESSDDVEGNAPEVPAAKKKKNKKKKPKKKKKAPAAQTEPPSVLISQLFPNNNYPKGEEVEYKDDNRHRTTNEENAI